MPKHENEKSGRPGDSEAATGLCATSAAGIAGSHDPDARNTRLLVAVSPVFTGAFKGRTHVYALDLHYPPIEPCDVCGYEDCKCHLDYMNTDSTESLGLEARGR